MFTTTSGANTMKKFAIALFLGVALGVAHGQVNQPGSSSTGTVTSVSFTGDGTVLSATPSTAVTASGTVAATLASAAANTVLANLTGSGAAPTYTALGTGVPTALKTAVNTQGGFIAIVNTGTFTATGSTSATICTSCAAGQYRISADIRVTVAGTAGAVTNFLYSYTDDIGAASNVNCVSNNAATSQVRYSCIQTFHLAASQNISVSTNCTNTCTAQEDYALEKIQ